MRELARKDNIIKEFSDRADSRLLLLPRENRCPHDKRSRSFRTTFSPPSLFSFSLLLVPLAPSLSLTLSGNRHYHRQSARQVIRMECFPSGFFALLPSLKIHLVIRPGIRQLSVYLRLYANIHLDKPL